MEENRRMSVWNWIGSLFLPVLQFLVGLPGLLLVINLITEGLLHTLMVIISPIGWFFISTLIIGGLIPIIITIKKRVDTSRYILFRLILVISAFLTLLFIGYVESITLSGLGFQIGLLILGVFAVFPTIYYFFRTKNRLEWVVIALSEPLSRVIFFLILLYIDLSGLSEGFNIPG